MIEPDPTPQESPRRPPAWEAVVILGACVALVGALGWWAFAPKPRGVGVPVGSARAEPGLRPGDDYIGSRACAECHPGEYAMFARSGHARTLRPAALHPVAKKLDGREVADPERPDVTWSYAIRDGRFDLDRAEPAGVERLLVDYAFGSGHHATTFVSVVDPSPTRPKCREHRLTYFTADGTLGITPGQREGRVHGMDDRGYELSPRETLKCFRCHTTRTSTAGEGELDLATMIPNVTCERCHGPARGHVEAQRRGESGPPLAFGFDSWTAEELLRFCGQCHRDPAKAPPGFIRPDNRQIARFQPVGLSQSRCYRESDGALSCVNCHDPHARAKSDRAVYEAACLQCHGTPPQVACPVSPKSGCIDCHMPRVDSGQAVLFTDHWIRVRDEAALRIDAGSASPGSH